MLKLSPSAQAAQAAAQKEYTGIADPILRQAAAVGQEIKDKIKDLTAKRQELTTEIEHLAESLDFADIERHGALERQVQLIDEALVKAHQALSKAQHDALPTLAEAYTQLATEKQAEIDAVGDDYERRVKKQTAALADLVHEANDFYYYHSQSLNHELFDQVKRLFTPDGGYSYKEIASVMPSQAILFDRITDPLKH